MFGDTLLDSSPAHPQILKTTDWSLALAVEVAGFLAGFLGLPLFLPHAEVKAQVMQSVILGVVLMIETLMLCYVNEEAHRLRLRAWVWLCLTLGLNLPGFFVFLVRSAIRTGNWKRAAVPAAYILETMLVSALILAPLIHTEALGGWLNPRWLSPPLTPPTRSAAAPARLRTPARRTGQEALQVPPVIPPVTGIFTDKPAPPEAPGPDGIVGVPPGLGNGPTTGLPGNLDAGPSAPPPPVPVVRHNQGIRRIRCSTMEPAKIIFQPKPEYPKLAQLTRTEGTVRLEAIISTDGTIQNLKVLSGHPLLVMAAVEAVARWRYQPTLLNGEPVEVVTDIHVSFTLNN
jgi:periplasmic protein TonB